MLGGGVMEVLFNREFWEERRLHREKIINSIQSFIKQPRREALIEIIGEIWALRFTYKDLEWYANERVLKYMSLEELAESFKLLLDEEKPLSERLGIKIPGFGSGAVSEILFSLNPDKYPVYNRKFVIGAKKLGYKINNLDHVVRLTPETLDALIKVHERIVLDFLRLKEEIEKKIGNYIPRFDFTDALLWKVAQDEISVRDVLSWKVTKRSTIDAEIIEQVLSVLGKGFLKYLELVNSGEPEDSAREKASFYIEGLLDAYGVDPEKAEEIFGYLAELLEEIVNRGGV
ncbi:hypothetical protein [Thermococcus alcaliphilus]|uniref:hypothetical protein n=1 Tax=Thermococcus alcaliphilus TaxID=139207 RepID=UPI0020901412|nr:hypothetical protein [Thermococcus alcaliphilus]MCO6041240.1 hypothetical protein [Thermococcus alcaliphilus]